MTHIENHPQAFVNERGIVDSIAVFAEHDADLIAACMDAAIVTSVVDCCEHGVPRIGQVWTGTEFIDYVEPEATNMPMMSLEEARAELAALGELIE
jgi:hypothetical protein